MRTDATARAKRNERITINGPNQKSPSRATSGAFFPRFQGAPATTTANAALKAADEWTNWNLSKAWIYYGVTESLETNLASLLRPLGRRGPRHAGVIDRDGMSPWASAIIEWWRAKVRDANEETPPLQLLGDCSEAKTTTPTDLEMWPPGKWPHCLAGISASLQVHRQGNSPRRPSFSPAGKRAGDKSPRLAWRFMSRRF